MKLVGTLAVIMLLTTAAVLPVQDTRPSTGNTPGGVRAPSADLLQTTGRITLLRAHDVGTGWGPTSDSIDGEVVIKLDSRPDQAYGFQLRNDDKLLARQGMLDLLRRAFNDDLIVTVNYLIESGKNNGILLRAWLSPFQRGSWLPLIVS